MFYSFATLFEFTRNVNAAIAVTAGSSCTKSHEEATHSEVLRFDSGTFQVKDLPPTPLWPPVMAASQPTLFLG